MRKRPLLSLAALLGLTLSVHAFDAVETFDYTPGSALNGQNGGTGWDGAWFGSSTPTVESPNLDFPDSSEQGNKAVLPYDSPFGSTYTIFRELGTTVSGATATTASFSFLFNLTGNDEETGIRFAGLSLFSGTGTELLFFGKPGNTTEVGIEKYAGGTLVRGVDTSFSSSTVFLFEADFVLSPDANSTVTVTLSSNAGDGTLLATWSDLSLGTGFSFDHIRLIRDYALDSDINPEVDEVKISTVPEPSAGLLVLLGTGLLLRRRR